MDTVAYTGRAHARTHAEVDCTRTLFKAIGDVVAELRDKSTLWPDEHTADAHATAIGDLAQLLSSLESRLDRFEDHIATERETVATARTLIADCAQEEQLMVHIANHLPPHLPGAQPELLQYEDPQPLMQQQQQRAFALPSASSSFRSSAATAVSVAVHLKDALAPAPPPGKAQGAHKVDDKAKAPREYISLAELESCSKYMVGRLTQDRINCSIDELAGVAERNGRAAHQRVAGGGVSKADRERYQEVLAVLAKHKVGKGRHWFTEFDLRNGAAIKCDKSGKSTLQVLRHLKRLTEIRGTVQGKAEVVYLMNGPDR